MRFSKCSLSRLPFFPPKLSSLLNRADIAVGAPFDGDGKVFIYRGSDAGIETKPAQVGAQHNTT